MLAGSVVCRSGFTSYPSYSSLLVSISGLSGDIKQTLRKLVHCEYLAWQGGDTVFMIQDNGKEMLPDVPPRSYETRSLVEREPVIEYQQALCYRLNTILYPTHGHF